MTSLRKESDTEWIHVYAELNCCTPAAHLELTQHYKSTKPQQKIKVKFKEIEINKIKRLLHLEWIDINFSCRKNPIKPSANDSRILQRTV